MVIPHLYSIYHKYQYILFAGIFNTYDYISIT